MKLSIYLFWKYLFGFSFVLLCEASTMKEDWW